MKSEIQGLLQHNQSCPAATGARQPPGYFRSRTALCSLGQELLLLQLQLPPVLFTASKNDFITHSLSLGPLFLVYTTILCLYNKHGSVFLFFLAPGPLYSDSPHHSFRESSVPVRSLDSITISKLRRWIFFL